jgi:hypothetical protein
MPSSRLSPIQMLPAMTSIDDKIKPYRRRMDEDDGYNTNQTKKKEKLHKKVGNEVHSWMSSTSTHGIGPMARSLNDNMFFFFIWLIIWTISAGYCFYSNLNHLYLIVT